MRERKLNRKRNYDYAQDGRYFVTIVTKHRLHWFGKIQNHKMELNECGQIAHKLWNEILWQTKWAKSISSAIRGYKIDVTKRSRENGFDQFQWQKSFHDKIIMTQKELENIRNYITHNPNNWKEEENFPS